MSRKLASIYVISFVISLCLILLIDIQRFDMTGLNFRQRKQTPTQSLLRPFVRWGLCSLCRLFWRPAEPQLSATWTHEDGMEAVQHASEMRWRSPYQRFYQISISTIFNSPFKPGCCINMVIILYKYGNSVFFQGSNRTPSLRKYHSHFLTSLNNFKFY